jgi:hypothetical protein
LPNIIHGEDRELEFLPASVQPRDPADLSRLCGQVDWARVMRLARHQVTPLVWARWYEFYPATGR